MRSLSDELPKSPWTRFAIGFFFVGLFIFLAETIYRSGSEYSIWDAAAIAAVAGVIAGVLSAFGRKWLSFIMEFFIWLGF